MQSQRWSWDDVLLRSISLQNIRSYKKLSLEFPPGYVLLQGDVGSGKSTILMATEFALFGLGAVKADSLLSKGENRGEVVLVFEVEDVRYEIGRTLIHKDGKVLQDPKGSYLLSDGTKEPLTASDLKARILQVLNFREPANPRAHSRIYRYAVYTPQEEIKSILDGGGREDVIRRAFGMEDYKTAADNAETLRAHISRKKDELAGRFARLEEYRADRGALTEEIRSLERNRVGLERARDDLAGKLAETESRQSGMEKQMKEVIRVRAEAAQTEREIADKKESLRKIMEGIRDDRAEISGIEKELQNLGSPAKPTGRTVEDLAGLLDMVEGTEREIHAKRSEAEGCAAAISNLGEKLGGKEYEAVQDAIASIESGIRSGDEESSSVEADMGEHRTGIGAKDNEIETLNEGLRRAERLGGRCEYCDSVLEPGYVAKLQEERRGRLAAAKSERGVLVGRMRECRERLDRIRERLARDRHMLEECKRDETVAQQKRMQEARLDALREDLESLDAESHVPAGEPLARKEGESPRDYLRRLRDSLREYHSATEKVTGLTRRKARLETRMLESEGGYEEDILYQRQREASLDEARAYLGRHGTLEDDIKACGIEMSRLRADLDQANRTVSAVTERIGNKKERAGQLDADVAEAEKHRARHNLYQDHEEWLSMYFIPSIYRIEKAVMESLRYDFDEFYGKWYSMLVDDPTKTSRIDERFGPVLEQGGYQQSVESLSGGEKTSVALAYRLAINSAMRRQAGTLRSNLLILDEPTDGFSSAQMEKVREILNSLKSEQIIMVSHEIELEGFVDHVFRITKNEGSSAVHQTK